MAGRANSSAQDAGLVAAAEAAASWARARRSTWTSEPLKVAVVDMPVDEPEDDALQLETVDATPATSAAAAPAESTRALGPAVMRWLPRAAAALAIVGVAYFAWPYASNLLSTFTSETPASKPADASRTAGTPATSRETTAGRGATGTLTVKSNPPAAVSVDGKLRGTTPVTLTDIAAGKHEVTLKADAGSVRKSITIGPNEKAEIEESIYSGFAAVYAPFEVTISEGGKPLRADDRSQLMLPAGPHELRITNRALSYDVVRQIEVIPGETTPVRLAPTSPVTITGTEAMDVWLDGTKVGQTPVNALQVAVGVHEVVVRKSSGAERKYSITVGGTPVTLNADF